MNNTSQREKMFKTSTDKSLFPASAGHRALSDETRILRTAPGKAINCAFRLSDLRQLHVLKDSIIQSKETVYVSAPYSRWDILVFSLSPIEEFLLDIIPTDKPVKWRHLVQSAQRAGIAPGQRSSDQSAVCDALATLTDQDIIITV